MSLAFVNDMKMKDGGGPGVTRNWRGDANTWMEMRREARIAEGERGERVARLRYEEIAPRLPRLPLRRRQRRRRGMDCARSVAAAAAAAAHTGKSTCFRAGPVGQCPEIQ